MRAAVVFVIVSGFVILQCLFAGLFLGEIHLNYDKLGLSSRNEAHAPQNTRSKASPPIIPQDPDHHRTPAVQLPTKSPFWRQPPNQNQHAPQATPSSTPSPSGYDEPQPGARELGFKAREDTSQIHEGNELIEVIIVPHSHCDAGWLKTFDRYYQDEVRNILTTITEALTDNPHRKFGWVEAAFLEKWWVEQTPVVKEKFRKLYENGQIEFLMGGWVSNDEATVTYMQCINQMTEGHRFLLQEFGEDAIPRIGWQIDPFGLSQATATMFSQMCFDANAAWRVGGTNRRDFLDRKLLEFIWRGSDSLTTSSDLLLHLLPWSYATQDDFLFEKSNSLNVGTENGLRNAATKLVESFKVRTEAYPSNTLMWPWGHDFMFTNAHKMFDTMDKVINYINENPSYNVHVRYGTPSEYFDILHQKEIGFPVLQQDFLPYGPTTINWWNGYYTSRPRLKAYCRYLDNIQRSAEFMYTWARTQNPHAVSEQQWGNMFDKLTYIRHIQGIMQHHDAITGTMREHVLLDYYKMIEQATADCAAVIEFAAPLLISPMDDMPSDFILVQPDTSVSISESPSPKFLMLFNSLPWNRQEIFSLFVDSPLVAVYDLITEEFIPSSILPRVPCFLHGEEKHQGYRLYFEADVPAVGYRIFALYYNPGRTFEDLSIYSNDNLLWKPALNTNELPGVKLSEKLPPTEHYIENDNLQVGFDSLGNLQEIIQKAANPFSFTNGTVSSKARLDINKNYWVYKSDPSWDNQYTFKALDDGTIINTEKASFYVIRSPLVQEIYQKVNGKMAQRISLMKGQNQIQVSDIIGPPDRGMNYVTRYSTSMESDGHFYTDDSGLEILQRTYNRSDIYSGNYYPMIYSSFIMEPSAIYSNNPFRQISLVSDRTHGITSVAPGSFDLMLHRNTLQHLGNGEKMEDWNQVEIVSWLLVTPEENYNRQQIAMRRNFPLTGVQFREDELQFVNDEGPTPSSIAKSFVGESFPNNVFLMNLEYNSKIGNEVAVRVNNLRQKRMFEFLDTPETPNEDIFFTELYEYISLSDLFHSQEHHLASIDERTLSLNQKIQDCKRHHWHEHTESQHPFRYGDTLLQQAGEIDNDGMITLPPLGIRSFLVSFANNNK